MRARSARWLRSNLFADSRSTVLTLSLLALFAWTMPPLLEWLVIKASLAGASRADCPTDGACWAFIRLRLAYFFYGRYPVPERWRVDLVLAGFLLFAAAATRPEATRYGMGLAAFVVSFPLLAAALLSGGILGLRYVPTNDWGGLSLNVILAFVAVAGSFPLGVLLAFGRRSRLPVMRWFSVAFIEFFRGIPLLTAIFMATVMLPLFLPEGATIDNVLRAMIALTLFTAAYMAEVVRGGLQGVPRGQYEAAIALGLGHTRTLLFIVLPQALRIVLPAIVNTVVDLFKDTTLVTIVGLFELLGSVNQALRDQAWLGLAREGYVFSAVVFFFACFAMSMYASRLERRLAAGDARRGA
jgi:general L-amino acid transport system permease protein